METEKGDIIISLVYSKCATNIKRFILSLPRNINCINYMDIVNTLSKNDYLQLPPSDEVISTQLMKKLQSTIEKKNPSLLYYVLSDVSSEVIESVIEYVKFLTDKKITYKLYHTPDIDVSRVKHLFSEIIQFNIDEET
jgi:hypothetical protein